MNTEVKTNSATKEKTKAAGPEPDRKVIIDHLEKAIREIEKDFSRIKYPTHSIK